jgi:hypothetical protein
VGWQELTRRRVNGPSGVALRAARKAAGLSQTALGALAGVGRHAVSYWECKPTIDRRGWAVQRMAKAVAQIAALLQDYHPNTHACGMGLSHGLSGLPDYSRPSAGARAVDGSYSIAKADAQLEVAVAKALASQQERDAQRRARVRVICSAKTTRTGKPCRNKSEAGRRRCKHHGGRSTGPKTAEGRERIAEAQRKRWALWRDRHANYRHLA